MTLPTSPDKTKEEKPQKSTEKQKSPEKKSPSPQKQKKEPEQKPSNKKDKEYKIKSKDFNKFAEMKENPKAASDDEKQENSHELFLKSLSQSINSYNLKEASEASDSAKASPKKITTNKISDISAEL